MHCYIQAGLSLMALFIQFGVNRTGGLAAPAIAAGLGSAVSLVGGSAATASAISGFAASTAGTATITSAFGAYGASQTGNTGFLGS